MRTRVNAVTVSGTIAPDDLSGQGIIALIGCEVDRQAFRQLFEKR